jgi:hypothetical protein
MPSRHRWGLSLRRLTELVLAGCLFLLSLGLLLQPEILVNRPFGADSIWVALFLIVPLLLGISVLYEAFDYWFRLGLNAVGASGGGDAEFYVPRLGITLVFCILAVQTLWGVTGSYYTLVASDSGGLITAPLIAILSGTLLGGLVIAHAVLARLFPESDVAKLRDPIQ